MSPYRLPKLGYEVGEQEQQERSAGKSQLLALQIAGAPGGHSREQRHTQGQATEKATNVCVVVDPDDAREVGADAENQI